MRTVDVTLSAQAALLAAATCAGAYTRTMPPTALCYVALFATVLALFMLWRGRWLWMAHVILTSALCVLCVWGAAFAPSVVRVVWHDGLHHDYDAHSSSLHDASPKNALYAASAVLVVSRLFIIVAHQQGQEQVGLTLLLAAFAIVALNAAAWDWSATAAFFIASALAVHLTAAATPAEKVAEPSPMLLLEEALARVWGTPAAFELVEALITRPRCHDPFHKNNNTHHHHDDDEDDAKRMMTMMMAHPLPPPISSSSSSTSSSSSLMMPMIMTTASSTAAAAAAAAAAHYTNSHYYYYNGHNKNHHHHHHHHNQHQKKKEPNQRVAPRLMIKNDDGDYYEDAARQAPRSASVWVMGK
jgi:hypothetical protein